MNYTEKRLYIIYSWIKQRCWYEKHNRYKNYWWRWIKNEWESFDEFYKDMWESYKEWLSIDRIDNDWNYNKLNCQWVTQKIQQNKRWNNIILEYNWEALSITQWSERLWYKRWILHSRYRKGWSTEKIIETKRFAKTKKRVLSEEHKIKISKALIWKNKK